MEFGAQNPHQTDFDVPAYRINTGHGLADLATDHRVDGEKTVVLAGA